MTFSAFSFSSRGAALPCGPPRRRRGPRPGGATVCVSESNGPFRVVLFFSFAFVVVPSRPTEAIRSGGWAGWRAGGRGVAQRRG